MAPTSDTAGKSATTTLRKRGIAETNRNTLSTIKALRTANASVDGTNVIATTMKSKTPGVSKKPRPFAKFRSTVSIENNDNCLIKLQ